MMLRSTLSGLALLLLSGAALAAPVLRADVVVTNAIVTMGDMFDDAGVQAETPLFRAPLPGTTGTVGIGDIDAALRRAGLGSLATNGLTAVRVSRAAAIIDEALLSALIADDLRARGIIGDGMSINTLFSTPLAPINAEAVDQPATIVSLRYLPGSGAFTARFAIAGREQALDLAGSIEVMVQTPHITANLPAGTLLMPENIEMRAVPLKFVETTGVLRLEDVLGKTLVRQSREGMMLKPADVTTPLAVLKNDPVTIYFRNGPMTLTVKGQAVSSAAAGQPVQVLNLMSKRVINATAIASGTVEVSARPLTIAGL